MFSTFLRFLKCLLTVFYDLNISWTCLYMLYDLELKLKQKRLQNKFKSFIFSFSVFFTSHLSLFIRVLKICAKYIVCQKHQIYLMDFTFKTSKYSFLYSDKVLFLASKSPCFNSISVSSKASYFKAH